MAVKRLGALHREAARFWDRNGLALAATATFMMEGAAELVGPSVADIFCMEATFSAA